MQKFFEATGENRDAAVENALKQLALSYVYYYILPYRSSLIKLNKCIPFYCCLVILLWHTSLTERYIAYTYEFI